MPVDDGNAHQGTHAELVKEGPRSGGPRGALVVADVCEVARRVGESVRPGIAPVIRVEARVNEPHASTPRSTSAPTSLSQRSINHPRGRRHGIARSRFAKPPKHLGLSRRGSAGRLRHESSVDPGKRAVAVSAGGLQALRGPSCGWRRAAAHPLRDDPSPTRDAPIRPFATLHTWLLASKPAVDEQHWRCSLEWPASSRH
jgi:hypothetical protein